MDSDAEDEAEAAWEALRDGAYLYVPDSEIRNVEAVLSGTSCLFKWDNEDGQDRDCFINLSHVSMVTHLHGHSATEYKLEVMVDGHVVKTDDQDTIDRFWAEWEVL